MFGLIKKTKAANDAADLVVKSLTQFFNSYSLTNGLVSYGFNDAPDQLNAYATVDDLYSVVRKLIKTCKRVPLFAYEKKDQKALGKYLIYRKKMQESRNYSNKNIWDLKELQYKALEIIGDQDELQHVLDNPNDWQSKDEFYEGAYGFMLLTGNNYIFKNVLGEGANKGRPFKDNAMWNLSPSFTFPIPSESLPRKPVAFKSTAYGQQDTFSLEEVIHRKYFNPLFDYSGNELVGLSPLHAGQRTLTQINNERDYANRSLINAGAEGAITSEDAASMSPEALGQMKDDVLRELGSGWDNGSWSSNTDPKRNGDLNDYRRGSNLNAKKLGFLAGKWNYLRLSISPADMQLIEQGKITFQKLCNLYGVSDILFNNDTAATESNVREQIGQLYTNTVIPEVCSLRDALQKGLAELYKDKERIIDFDVSDIAELQEDTTEIVTRFANAPAFRVNDMYEALGWGRLDDPNADVVLIKQGYQPLEDIASPVNMDITNAVDYQNPR